MGIQMRRLLAAALAAGSLAGGIASLASAQDRAPSSDEMRRIEAALKAENFSRWDDVERSADGMWEVEEALGADGRHYRLKLDRDYRIIDRRPE